MALVVNVWNYTNEYQWLGDYIQKLRQRAVNDMESGLDMETYAMMRGYIHACDDVLKAPDKYIKEMRAREEVGVE